MTDQSVGLSGTMGMGSGSEFMNAVVDQLLPRPLRYRLVWNTDDSKHPLYIWRAVPPTASFIALGMVATSSDDPPSLDAMRCVPKRWCVRHGEPPRAVWRDAGQGGRPGSLWSNGGGGLQLLLGATGHEPPAQELSWRFQSDRRPHFSHMSEIKCSSFLLPSTPFPHMWRPHFSHMSEINSFF